MEGIQVGRGDGTGYVPPDAVRVTGTTAIPGAAPTRTALNGAALTESDWPNMSGMTGFKPIITEEEPHMSDIGSIGLPVPINSGRLDITIEIKCVKNSPCFQDLEANLKEVRRVTADPSHTCKHDCRWVVDDQVFIVHGVFVTDLRFEGGPLEENPNIMATLRADRLVIE